MDLQYITILHQAVLKGGRAVSTPWVVFLREDHWKMADAAASADPHFKIKKPTTPFFKLKELHMVMSWKFMGQTVCAICKAPLDQPAVEYVRVVGKSLSFCHYENARANELFWTTADTYRTEILTEKSIGMFPKPICNDVSVTFSAVLNLS